MAWFKNNNEADVPQPVTLDRVSALFDRKGWHYNLEEDRIMTAFDGFIVGIRIPEEPYLSVAVAYPEAPISRDRLIEVQQWAATRNREGTIGTCQVLMDEDESMLVLSDHTVLINEGATDEQLEIWVSVCMEAQLIHLASLCEQFEIPPCLDQEEEE